MAQAPLESWDNLKQLQVGQKVEITDWDMKSVTGAFVSYSDEEITVRGGKDVVVIQRKTFFEVLSREHSKRARNALIGMSAGVGVGVALGLATKAHYPLAVPLGLFFGSTAAGAAAGAAIPSYPIIYRANKKSAPR